MEELKYQLEAIKAAVAQMEYGIENNDVRYIKAEMRQFKSKAESVLEEAEIVINESL